MLEYQQVMSNNYGYYIQLDFENFDETPNISLLQGNSFQFNNKKKYNALPESINVRWIENGYVFLDQFDFDAK